MYIYTYYGILTFWNASGAPGEVFLSGCTSSDC